MAAGGVDNGALGWSTLSSDFYGAFVIGPDKYHLEAVAIDGMNGRRNQAALRRIRGNMAAYPPRWPCLRSAVAT
jgi:hypothetical protein